MNTVIFKTENAVFQFDREDVKEHFYIMTTEYDLDEALTLLNRIKIPIADPLTINEEHYYFGYIVLDLIDAAKGSVKCNACDKMFNANQLRSIAIGAGENLFNINIGKKGGIKNIRCRNKQPSMFGGKGYECPEGHELISMITWRT